MKTSSFKSNTPFKSTTTTTTEANRFTPLYTTERAKKASSNGFWPTPRPQRGRKTMTRATTRSPPRRVVTTATTTTAAPTTTTVTSTTATYSPALDTSAFLIDDSVFDLERLPGDSFHTDSGLSVEGGGFVTSSEEGGHSSRSDYATPREVSTGHGSRSQPQARIPIRNVLDIFQELRLSFGKRNEQE